MKRLRTSLDQHATEAGIVIRRHGPDGVETEIPEESKRLLLTAVGKAARRTKEDLQPPPPGSTTTCHLPAFLEKDKAWGLALQLYEVRSRRNWGIGDFTDLAELGITAALAGADFLGLNPLHALFLAEPGRCSPFSPSNRLFLNPLYIAVDAIEPNAASLVDPAALDRVRASELVLYAEVAALKLTALRAIWENVDRRNPALRAFAKTGGAALRGHVLFEALSAAMVAAGHGAGWRDWPPAYRDRKSAETLAFAEANADQIEFHIWLQFVADRQLGEAARAVAQAGMRIGLYLDLAVGDAPDGSATWSDPTLFVPGVTIGAPPDVFSSDGQEWGLAALSPRTLAAGGGGRFAEMAGASMAHSGALRLDHAMALRQLFLVPEGLPASEGAHVLYPFALMLEELASTSRKHGTIVVGEDLGFVPPGFQDIMRETNILSYRILYFEQQGYSFADHDAYPRIALACLSTHDLPTLTGWWEGNDIDLRAEFELVDPTLREEHRRHRGEERRWLAERLGLTAEACSEDPGLLTVEAHGFIARTPCLLAVARLADIVGERMPTNLPGTVDQYPNWRRKLDIPLEEIGRLPLWSAVCGRMATLRPRRA